MQRGQPAVQDALFEIADLSYQANSIKDLLARAHTIISTLMYAENFYLAILDENSQSLSFPYFVDTQDPEPNQQIAPVDTGALEGSLSLFLINNDAPVFTPSPESFSQLLTQHQLKLVGAHPQCLMGVPLRWGDNRRGAMVVQSYQKDANISETDLNIFTFLARQIAITLDRFQQRETLEKIVASRTATLQQKNRELKSLIEEREQDKQRQIALYNISTLAHSSDNLKSVYPKLHRILDSIFPAKNFYVSLLSDDGETITFPYFADREEISTKSRKLGNGATEYLLHLRKPILLNRQQSSALIQRGEFELIGKLPEYWMGSPIIIGDEAFGVIVSQSYDPTTSYSAKDLELLSFAAEQLAEALKRQRDSDALMLANITLEARVEQRTWELSQINGKLEQEVEERRRAELMQKALFSISEITQSGKDMAGTYKEIHHLIGQFIHAENFFIAEFDQAQGKLYFPYYQDTHQNLADFTEQSGDDPCPHMPLELIDKTLTAYVIRTRQALLANADTFKRLEQQGDVGLVGENPVDWLGVPLFIDGEVSGVIVVQTYTENHRLTEQDLALLQFASSHISTALERRQYRESLEKSVENRTKELAKANKKLKKEIAIRKEAENLQVALYKIADLSSSTTNLNSFYKQIHKIVGQLMYAEHFFIALVDHEQNTINFPYYVDHNEMAPSPRAMGNHLSEWVIQHGKPLLVTPKNLDEISQFLTIKGREPVSWLGVPLIVDDKSVGVLAVQTYSHDFILGKDEEHLLTYVSHHVGTALQRISAREALEQRVAQRTQELRQANLSLQSQIEKRRKIEKKLAHDAFHDTLTNLPNRALFMDRLSQIIAKGKREKKFRYAVLFLDLDRFKIINDSLGHLAGDKLLISVAHRLTEIVRPQDTVARLGGDEFCLLLDDISGIQHAEQVAQRIAQELIKPFIIDGNEIFTSTSIGIAHSTLDYTNPEAMLRDADAAMYQAKSMGKRQYVVFDQSMHKKALNTLKLETELRNAIDQSEIDVYFQPIIDLANNSIHGFEALARWQHSNQGLISPGDFIPLAEDTGLIIELDFLVCKKACIQLADWHKQFDQSLTININLSSKHFTRFDLTSRIVSILELSGIKPQQLKIEITESALMHNVSTAQKLLSELKTVGVQLAIDDFGTGYSSLSYLHKFPLDYIKIDRCFVDGIDEKKENFAIVKTIVTLAEALGMTSVAEGIESLRQQKLLQQLNCQLGQGFLISRPLSVQQAQNWLASQVLKPTHI